MKKDIYRLAAIAAVLIAGLVIVAVYYLRAHRAERAEEVAKQARTAVFVRPHSRSFGPTDAKGDGRRVSGSRM